MKKEYDFSNGSRGAVLRVPPGKTRITIRLDDDILDWFRDQVDKAGGGSYQTMINSALRNYIQNTEQPISETLRQIIREELSTYHPMSDFNKKESPESK
ncbi:MAG: BrnA antitoxin family protein [Acidobacteria bacterium]|nr:BrnA antitoxin family protein [Acidobacteriota bacterium]